MNNVTGSLQLLNSEQKRNIALALFLLLIPVAANFFIVRDYVEQYIKQLDSVRKIADNSRLVNNNAGLFDMLYNVPKENHFSADIVTGVKAGNFNKYFNYYASEAARLERERLAALDKTQQEVKKGQPESTTPVRTIVTQPVIYPNRVTFIYESGTGSYVIIDNKLLKAGETTKSGMKVRKIENNRVLLEGKRSSKWVKLSF